MAEPARRFPSKPSTEAAIWAEGWMVAGFTRAKTRRPPGGLSDSTVPCERPKSGHYPASRRTRARRRLRPAGLAPYQSRSSASSSRMGISCRARIRRCRWRGVRSRVRAAAVRLPRVVRRADRIRSHSVACEECERATESGVTHPPRHGRSSALRRGNSESTPGAIRGYAHCLVIAP